MYIHTSIHILVYALVCTNTNSFCSSQEVTQAFEDYNADAFTDVVFNFDNVSKLDPWKTRCCHSTACIHVQAQARHGVDAPAYIYIYIY